jgi:ribosomal protein L16/L10AE
VSLVDIPETYSLEYALRARKARLERMHATAPRRPIVMQAPAPTQRVTDVDFGTEQDRRRRIVAGQLEAKRIMAEQRALERECKKIQRWCQMEIWRCKRESKRAKSRHLRLKHGRSISDEVPGQAKAIIASVIQKYGITEAELLARPVNTRGSASQPMHEAAWRLYSETKPQLSLGQIGLILGRHHTTILHSVRTHQFSIDPPEIKKCANCGRQWVPDKKIRKFCSRECSSAHAHTRGGGRPPKCEAV